MTDAATRHALGPLASLLDDATVTEIMVNGPGPVWIERRGRIEQAGVAVDRPVIGHLIERVVAPLGLRADRSAPLVDARLPDGSRFNAVLPPLAVDGPYVTIRRFARSPVPLDRFCDDSVVAVMRQLVESRRNIVVCGATSSGKTTLLNALADAISPAERVVTIEDAAELRLGGGHVVRLEARPANAEGAGGFDMRALLRNALRMRPDRIVIGEVRDGAAFDLLQALNTGHDGSLSTCHANGPVDALARLETMALMGDVALPLAAARRQLVAAVDVLVHVARGHGGDRVVRQVVEVDPALVRGVPSIRPIVQGGAVIGEPRRPPRSAP